MYKTTFKSAVSLLFAAVFLVPAYSVEASDWKQIGYGTLQGGSRFDVYVDTRTILHIGDKVRFWQGHVFHTEQPLPSGSRYMRVSIEREGDCVEKSDKSLQAIFYARDGSVVYNYSGNNTLKPASPDSVSLEALEFACTYNKLKQEGISR